MELEALVESLADRLGLPDLRLDSQGVATVASADGRVELTLEQGETAATAYLYATVGQAPEKVESREALFAKLLGAQLFSAQIGEGISIGLDRDTGEILVNQTLELSEMHPEEFYDAVSRVYLWSDYWMTVFESEDFDAMSGPGGVSIEKPGEIEHYFIKA